MLTPEAFRVWCEHLHFAPETEALITTIRESPPVRKVRGRANNVTGRYPSPKMGCSIQFESQHVELWAIYAMERDDDVLEYYDQSARIPLHYRAKSGRNTTQWHTPDFFVIRRERAGWEEWKPASVLDTLFDTMPARYQQDTTGRWRCPPGESYAEQVGLTYQVRSSDEYHPLFIQNLKFLQDYWAHPTPIDPSQEVQILRLIEQHPGLPLPALLEVCPGVPVDVVWELLSTYRLFTDLSATPLMDHSNVFLFPSEQEMRVHDQVPAVETKASASSPPLAWDGRIWFVEEIGTLVHLRPEVGERLSLAFATFEQLIQTGAMQQLSETAPSPMTPEVRAALTAASPKAQHRANERLQQILLYVQGGEVRVPKRSIQRWLHAYTSAETQYGCGYVGLLDHVALRGNRNRRAPDASMQLLQTFLKEHYATPQAKRAAAVYHLYVSECERVHLSPVSERTFYRERAHFATPDVTGARLGRRAAYGEQPFFYSLDQTTPRHGQRPFELAHLDHTELDLLLVSSVTGKPLEKPWLTLLTDAYSRRILACYLSYDPPSYRSTMMILRICVQRHLRLPQEIMVDRGADFGSVYFETLLSRYEVTKKERPPAQPRFGSILERLFGTTNTMLLNQLRGNTQATKVPRQMDRSVNPKHQAVWTLQRFSERFDEWAYEVYDQMEHPALFQSPRDTFTQGMARAGMRLHRLIAYSEEFLMLTRPTTHTGQVKIHAARGITVNGLRYWNAVFQNREVAGTSVPVRYEPYDMAVVYVFVQGQWLECIADNYAQVHGRSEREWHLILDEWRAHQRQHGKARTQVNGPLQAHFLETLEADERMFLQQQRDYEERALRDAFLGKKEAELVVIPSASPVAQMDEDDLDLTTIPRYEEYR
jgi:putative transposase